MDDIVGQARSALQWLHRQLAALGGDPARLYVGGWSAGGHLTAMLMGSAERTVYTMRASPLG